ncbi:MAG: hypothetical protein LBG28_10610 [Tannerella sp.]|jgi:hypothetical protein|nr:hypothetical protein [Tannerella sp.]
MKKIFILIAIVSLGQTSCKSYKEYSRTLHYDEFKDFSITESNSVNFEYEPVGSVLAIVESGFINRTLSLASEEDALRLLYEEAKKAEQVELST